MLDAKDMLQQMLQSVIVVAGAMPVVSSMEHACHIKTEDVGSYASSFVAKVDAYPRFGFALA